jgi:hypothetical protein
VNAEDFKALADHASTIEGHKEDRLVEVHDRIQKVGRRRQLVAVTASAIAVVLALTAGTAVLALTDNERTPPANPPRPTDTPSVVEAPSVRRLVWAVGDKVHFGGRTIDAPGEVSHVDATDDGVVFITGGRQPNGHNTIWFSEGSTVERIGRTSGSTTRGYGIETSTAGSYLVWGSPPALWTSTARPFLVAVTTWSTTPTRDES